VTLSIGSTAPDSRHHASEGSREWLGEGWGILFSHPKDFTPVCTTELGSMARLKPEFDKAPRPYLRIVTAPK
jgi:alkyl hydroperoxide reductase subunit AhpC